MQPAEKVRVEMEAFRRMLPDLLPLHAGKWVVFLDGKVQAFFDDESAAYDHAIRTFGPSRGFVVAQVAPERPAPVTLALNFGVVG